MTLRTRVALLEWVVLVLVLLVLGLAVEVIIRSP